MGAVVGSALKVLGVEGVRVRDYSAIPTHCTVARRARHQRAADFILHPELATEIETHPVETTSC